MCKEISIHSENDMIPLRKHMTPSQYKILDKFYIDIFIYDSHQSCKRLDEIDYSRYEYKHFKVKITDHGLIWISSIVGRVNDERTMASVFGRTRRLISVGKRGKCTLWGTGKSKKDTVGYRQCLYTI